MRHSVLDRQSMFRVSASLALLLCASQGRGNQLPITAFPVLSKPGKGMFPAQLL